ncbi:hypothetical protein Vi05172_g721 [Venturia inaequalis]|nr:hypothetical protein Vi05172_g721 [Venturia inaequalis]
MGPLELPYGTPAIAQAPPHAVHAYDVNRNLLLDELVMPPWSQLP